MKGIQKFLKFLAGVLAAMIVIGLLGVWFFKRSDSQFFLRDPSARMRWSDGETRNWGTVYWKPFTDEYLAEIEIGAGVYGWAWIDRAGEMVSTPESPTRVLGLCLMLPRSDPGLDPSPPYYGDDQVNEWRYAFSNRMVTFDDGRYRCKLEF